MFSVPVFYQEQQGGTPFTPEYAVFDGVGDGLVSDAVLTAADTKTLLFYANIKFDGAERGAIITNAWNLSVLAYPTGMVRFTFRNSTITMIEIDILSLLEIGITANIIAALDIVNGTLKIYKDDILFREVTNVLDGTLYLSQMILGVGRSNTGIFHAKMTTGAVYMSTELLDFSDTSNFRKFYGTDGAPVDIQNSGAPSPIILFQGPDSEWNNGNNKGAGGPFTMNGAVE